MAELDKAGIDKDKTEESTVGQEIDEKIPESIENQIENRINEIRDGIGSRTGASAATAHLRSE